MALPAGASTGSLKSGPSGLERSANFSVGHPISRSDWSGNHAEASREGGFCSTSIRFTAWARPMTTRKSKIARLPFNIREELNHQIMDNVPTKDILNWLNSDPTVRHYMERLFQNRYITDQCTARQRFELPCRGAPYA
jgi:hypothetical protein